MVDSSTYTPETLQRRYKIAEQLLGDPKKPITHWAEGLNELAKGFVGGRMLASADAETRAGERAQTEALARMLGGTPDAAPTVPPVAPQSAPPVAPAPEVSPATPMADLPRGLRNNNPLNIEAGTFTQGQPGFTGSDGRFARFETPEAGVGAANKLLDIYQNKHGLNTVSGIVGRWAPAGDGNDVSAYAANVAKALNIDPNAPIPPEMRPQLIAAMGQHENGRPIGDVATALNGTKVAQAAPAAPSAQPAPPNVAVPGIPGSAPSTIQAGDSRARVAAMLNDPNPYVRKVGQTLAQGIIAKQVEGEKPTDEMREYDLYGRQGGKDSFFDYKAGLKKAGAQNITIDQKAEGAFDTEAAKVQAKRFDELTSEGQKAKQMLADVEVLTDLGKQIGTGKAAQAKAVLGPYAEAFGIKIDKLDDIQAFEAVVNRMAPNLRVPGSGAQSDYELRNFLKSLPNLGNTPGGNEIAASVMQGLYQNKVRAAEIGSKALTKEITRAEAEKQLRELPDPMEPYREFTKKNKAAATSGKGAAPAPEFTQDQLLEEARKRGIR